MSQPLVLVVEDEPAQREVLTYNLEAEGFRVAQAEDGEHGLLLVDEDAPDVIVLDWMLPNVSGIEVCRQLKMRPETRGIPIIMLSARSEEIDKVRGLETGADDYVVKPYAVAELIARVRTQLRRYRYSNELRKNLSSTVAMAVIDGLTGLYNRRYFDRHMCVQLDKAKEGDRNLGLMMLDIDFFKSVNDTHGHAAGDEVLKEFAARLQRNIRGVDLACRYGGEEFVVMMPDTDLVHAKNIAERIRHAVASEPFDTGITMPLNITVSVGISINELQDDTPEQMLKRADIALYRAKREGRNRIVYDAA